MGWEEIRLIWRGRSRLADVIRLAQSANHLNIARNLYDALGKPERVVFLRDGRRLGIMGGEGEASRACVQPRPSCAVRVSATGIIRMLTIKPGLYAAHIEEWEGKQMIVMELED